MPDDLHSREPAPNAPLSSVRKPLVPSGVLAMLLFVAVEAMLFAGLISAFLIVKSAAQPGAWPPSFQPRLPVGETLINTIALLASGALFIYAARVFKRDRAKSFVPFLASTLLGAFFVLFQGYEWQGLIREGLTMTTSQHGAFFYLIVGCHALHAIGALIGLGWMCKHLYRGKLVLSEVRTVQVLWMFVVGAWPIIYALVYL